MKKIVFGLVFLLGILNASISDKTQRSVTLMEVYGDSGIPALLPKTTSTVTTSGSDVVIHFILDGASTIFVANYGTDSYYVNQSARVDGMYVTVPNSAKYVNIVSDAGSIIYEIDGVDSEPSVTPTTNCDSSSVYTQTENIKLELGVGWNLVSIPGYTSYPIEELFAPEEGMAITSSIKSVWVFDKGLAKWLSYVPGVREGTLINLYPGQGFWVNNKFNMNFEFSGQVQKEDLIYKGDGLGDIEKPPGVGN